MDGDGLDDIIVGSPYLSNGGSTGNAYLILGSSLGENLQYTYTTKTWPTTRLSVRIRRLFRL